MIYEEERGEENLEMNTDTVGTEEENDNNSKDCTDRTSSGQGIENIEEENNVNKQSANTENIVLNDFENASNEEKEMVRKIVELMNNPDREGDYDFRKVNKIRVVEETRKVNNVLKYIETSNITETNRLLKAVSMLGAERIWIQKKNTSKRNTEPWWKRRIINGIKQIQKDLAILERKRRRKLRREGKYKVLERKYNLKTKGLTVVIEKLKQRVTAKKAKVKRYEQRIKQYRKNRLFSVDPRDL